MSRNNQIMSGVGFEHRPEYAMFICATAYLYISQLKSAILTEGFRDRNLDRKFSPFANSRYALQPPAVFIHNNLITN